jgi:hypothetical protein
MRHQAFSPFAKALRSFEGKSIPGMAKEKLEGKSPFSPNQGASDAFG